MARYYQVSRPDMRFVVHLFSRYVNNPKQQRITAIKRVSVLRYLLLQKILCITYGQCRDLIGYFETELANHVGTRNFTTVTLICEWRTNYKVQPNTKDL